MATVTLSIWSESMDALVGIQRDGVQLLRSGDPQSQSGIILAEVYILLSHAHWEPETYGVEATAL